MRSTNATAQGYVFCSELALLLCRITGAYDGDVAPEYCTPGVQQLSQKLLPTATPLPPLSSTFCGTMTSPPKAGRLFDLLTGEMGGRKCANEHVFPLCGHAPRRNYAIR